MISADDALKIILSSISVKEEIETISFIESDGRVLAQDIIAGFNVPPADNSAMDGYAVISGDTEGSTASSPIELKIAGENRAGGTNHSQPLPHGYAVRIMTGAHIPQGADAVIPFEDTEETADRVKIFNAVKKTENIRFAGESFLTGDTVMVKGSKIESAHIALLASLNKTEVTVFKKPMVTIISSGDELTEPGPAAPGDKIINSNAYVLMNEIKNTGGIPSNAGIVKDSFEDLKKIIEKALSGDMVVCTGGVSMGRYDLIPDVLKSLGAEILFHNISVKPGKPLLFSRIGKCFFFGLPGNPVSTMVSFIEFVRPAILKMSGSLLYQKPVVKAVLKEKIHKQAGRKHFIRGRFTIVDGLFNVVTTGNQRSDMINSLRDANCLIIIPEEVETVEKNTVVDIQLIKHGEIDAAG